MICPDGRHFRDWHRPSCPIVDRTMADDALMYGGSFVEFRWAPGDITCRVLDPRTVTIRTL